MNPRRVVQKGESGEIVRFFREIEFPALTAFYETSKFYTVLPFYRRPNNSVPICRSELRFVFRVRGYVGRVTSSENKAPRLKFLFSAAFIPPRLCSKPPDTHPNHDPPLSPPPSPSPVFRASFEVEIVSRGCIVSMIRLRSVELKYSPSEIEMDGDLLSYRSPLFNIDPPFVPLHAGLFLARIHGRCISFHPT